MPDTNHNELLRNYRKEHFAVELHDPQGGSLYLPNDEKILSITHNGRQWESIALTKIEASQVIESLQKWLKV